MPKALYIPHLPALPKLCQEAVIHSNGDVDPILCPVEGHIWVPVVVGNLAGHYCIQKHKVVAATGKVYSPTGFECAGGKENNRKWRLSIRILLPSGERGRTLGMWLVSHKLDHLIPQTSPRKSNSSTYRSSEDNNSGGRTTTSSGFGSSQATGSLALTKPRPSPDKRYRNQEDDGSPSRDEASPSKMLRKAFFNAPTGSSLNIPEPTPPPMSPNPADVIGAFMQHHLAIYSPGNTPVTQAPLGVGLGVGLPPRIDNNAPNYIGATPTLMQTPDSPPQLHSLRAPLFNYNNGISPIHTPESPRQLQSLPPLLQDGPIPPANLIPLGSVISHGGGYNDSVIKHLESFVTSITHNTNNNNAANDKNRATDGTGVGGNINGPPIVSTGFAVFPSRVIETDYLDPLSFNEEEKGGVTCGGGGGGNSSEPLLGRGARSQSRRAKQEGQETPGSEVYHRKDNFPIRASAPAPHPSSNFNPQFPSYTTTPRPTAAALAAARAASAQHHVEALTCTQFQPLPFRQDSGSSLDLARVFDYGDYSPGGGLTGFTPLLRSPGGGSADWGGGIDSITFSFGGAVGGAPHCGRVQNNGNDTNIKNKNEDGGEVDEDVVGMEHTKKKKISDASTDSISNEKTRRRGSPPLEMLDVVTPEGETAAEEAGKKSTVTAPAAAVGDGGLVNNPVCATADKDNNEQELVVEATKNVREPGEKAAPFLADAAAAECEKESGNDDADGKDGKGLLHEFSCDSSNLGDKEVRTVPKEINQTTKEVHNGLYAEDSGVFDQREKADVQIL